MANNADFVTSFWKEKYLDEYIAKGGSKIKFVTGSSGSGKTALLTAFSSAANAAGASFIVANLSAKTTWLHDFKEIYTAVLGKADLIACLGRVADKIIFELGYEPKDIPAGISFTDYLASAGQLDPITKREIRVLLNRTFMENPLIDNNFALSCSLITGEILGHPTLEQHSRETLLMWMSGNLEVKLSAVRALGLSPSRITKYNARHMLRSLAEVVVLAGYSGIVITVDDLEQLIKGSGLEEIRYTKMRRDDAYESVRELIDEIDTLKNIMFVFAFDRSLIDDDNHGIKSYQALWMRIQNEIEGERFNRFTDIVDMDKLSGCGDCRRKGD
jgi:Cdc6-like AAA superfamily ATPase